jgi:molybdopterin-binding protein
LATLAQEDGSALNFWEGTVQPDEPGEVHDAEHTLRRVQVAPGVVIHVLLPQAGPDTRVRLSVPPSAVTVAKKTAETTSARNQLEGTVVAMNAQDGMLKVTVDAGINVTALLTPDAGQELELAAGVEVVVGFKAAAIRTLSVS